MKIYPAIKENRTFVLIIHFVVIFFLFLTQCSPVEKKQPTAASLSQGKIVDTLNFIGHWLHEGRREDLVRNIAREYEFTHQDIYVNL